MAIVLETPFSSLLLPLALLLLPLFIWLYVSSRCQKRLPPSPPKFPIVGNLFQLGTYPHRSLQALSRKYGSFMMIHLGSKPILVASSAEVAREIMKTHDLVFSNRSKTAIVDRLLYGSKDVAAAPYGEYWRQVRSICVLQLLSNKRVQSYRKVREEETSIMIEKIRKRCSSSREAINLSEILVELTNDVICRIALGMKYGDEEDGGRDLGFFKEFGELLGTFDVGDYIPWLGWLNGFNGLDAKVERVGKQIDGFLDGIIEDHRNRRNRDASIDQTGEEETGLDFVDILLEIQREDMAGFTLELESLKAIVLVRISLRSIFVYLLINFSCPCITHVV